MSNLFACNKCLFFFVALLFVNDLLADDVRYVPITRYDIYNGLPGNRVTKIGQSENGNIWISTNNGMAKFNAISFRQFKKDTKKEHSLPSNAITLFTVSGEDLWISHNQLGLSFYDAQKDQFKLIDVKENSPDSIMRDMIFAISTDKQKNVWIFQFGQGISVWEHNDQVFTHYKAGIDNVDWLRSTRFFDAKTDLDNNIWATTLDGEVLKIDTENRNAHIYTIEFDPKDAKTGRIYAISISKQSNVYISGYTGVYKLNRFNNEFKKIISEKNIADLMGERLTVRNLLIDKNENLWLATKKGLMLYRKNTLMAIKFLDRGKPSKHQTNIRDIFEDQEGNLWIATDVQGAFKIPANWENIAIHIPFKNPGLEKNRINTVFVDNSALNNTFWIFNEANQSLIVTVYQNGRLQHKKQYGKSHKLPKTINTLFQDSSYRLWLSSVTGLYYLDQSSQSFKKLSSKQVDLSINAIFSRDNSVLYVNKYGENQLYQINTNTLESKALEDGKMLSNIVLKTIEGPDNTSWIIGNAGLESFNHETKKLTPLIKNAENFSDILLSSDGESVWLLSNGKIIKYNL
ncbi:MAG: hypothetical protein L3J52_07165, partial [Proteobacteria bacterium]|nr:hypothetical protein [Pseudomonadota bacterium]